MADVLSSNKLNEDYYKAAVERGIKMFKQISEKNSLEELLNGVLKNEYTLGIVVIKFEDWALSKFKDPNLPSNIMGSSMGKEVVEIKNKYGELAWKDLVEKVFDIYFEKIKKLILSIKALDRTDAENLCIKILILMIAHYRYKFKDNKKLGKNDEPEIFEHIRKKLMESLFIVDLPNKGALDKSINEFYDKLKNISPKTDLLKDEIEKFGFGKKEVHVKNEKVIVKTNDDIKFIIEEELKQVRRHAGTLNETPIEKALNMIHKLGPPPGKNKDEFNKWKTAEEKKLEKMERGLLIPPTAQKPLRSGALKQSIENAFKTELVNVQNEVVTKPLIKVLSKNLLNLGAILKEFNNQIDIFNKLIDRLRYEKKDNVTKKDLDEFINNFQTNVRSKILTEMKPSIVNSPSETLNVVNKAINSYNGVINNVMNVLISLNLFFNAFMVRLGLIKGDYKLLINESNKILSSITAINIHDFNENKSLTDLMKNFNIIINKIKSVCIDYNKALKNIPETKLSLGFESMKYLFKNPIEVFINNSSEARSLLKENIDIFNGNKLRNLEINIGKDLPKIASEELQNINEQLKIVNKINEEAVNKAIPKDWANRIADIENTKKRLDKSIKSLTEGAKA